MRSDGSNRRILPDVLAQFARIGRTGQRKLRSERYQRRTQNVVHRYHLVRDAEGHGQCAIVARLLRLNRLRLLTLPRKNRKVQISPAVSRIFNAVRQIIENVNGQLTE